MSSSLVRRIAAVSLGFALLAVSCGGGPESTAECVGGTLCLNSITQNGVQVDLLQAQEALPTGEATFTFGMVTKQGALLTGGSPQVWIARDGRTRPLGPFRATFHRFTVNHEDHSPRTPLTGFYAAPLEIPGPGTWSVAAVADVNGSRLVGAKTLSVTSGEGPARAGTKAIAVETPVATNAAEAKRICTRKPPDPMHYISLERALRNGKPTVVTFATPLLCESQICGPVVDEQLLVFERVGAKRANFVHVEEFPPGADLKPDPQTIPSYWRKWGFTTEPWTVIIDGDGIIRARFEGPVVAALIEDALKPLL
ncbi:MAG TPA: hypothetical protein VHI54_02725 [Actinomycetota bacterium]|nr:hypothetical protein [Actinomycetota bacterium]